ncbi:MAG: hypothetical protein OHK0029_40720 [Armatimonadaceae bacterium]
MSTLSKTAARSTPDKAVWGNTIVLEQGNFAAMKLFHPQHPHSPENDTPEIPLSYLTAAEIMTRPVVTLTPDQSLRQAAQVLSRWQISGAPVVDESQRLIGVLSEKDALVQFQSHFVASRLSLLGLENLSEEAVREALSSGMTLTVGEVMSTPPIWAVEDDPVLHLVDLMTTHRINRVPIVRAAKVIGIVTRNNVLSALNRASE